MKRTRDADLEALNAYLQTPFASSARYNEATQCFNYTDDKGMTCDAGGLLSFLRAAYYPHYVEGRKPTRWGKSKGKPSNAAQGIQVDNDMERIAKNGGIGDNQLHPMSRALLEHWQRKGHTIVAAQVPVRVDAMRMTRADVITRDGKNGKLYVWEIKSGMANALHDKQGDMRNIPGFGSSVPCTKANHWQLQCEYTRHALVGNAGLPIAGGRVIQVYEGRGNDAKIEVKEHRNAPWLKRLFT